MDPQQCPTDEQLTQFLEGELAEADVVNVNNHLADCTRCQSKLDAQTESHLVADFSLRDSTDDPAISKLVSRLSVLSPWPTKRRRASGRIGCVQNQRTYWRWLQRPALSRSGCEDRSRGGD